MDMFAVPLSFEDSGLEEGDTMSLGEWFEMLQRYSAFIFRTMASTWTVFL